MISWLWIILIAFTPLRCPALGITRSERRLENLSEGKLSDGWDDAWRNECLTLVDVNLEYVDVCNGRMGVGRTKSG